MFICENCGKTHNGLYGSGRFCSEYCAKSYSSKYNKRKLKEVNCVNCGKKISINKHSSGKNALCEECKQNHIEYLGKNKVKQCPICGKKILKGNDCDNNFCKKHNYKQFKTLIKYFTFDESKLKTNEVEKEFIRVKNLLYNLYWNDGLCGEEISKIYGYKNSHNLTQSIFKYLEIPTRNIKDCLINSYLHNRFSENISKNIYKAEWHTTWNNKEVYLRSSYELDYAKELDEQKIDYDVECLRIKYFNTKLNEYHCAIPDFYLKESNTIVEIKSNYTLDIQEMKDKFKAYKDLGYNTKLILDHKEFNLD